VPETHYHSIRWKGAGKEVETEKAKVKILCINITKSGEEMNSKLE
jgi:hypothetical protein